MDLSVCHRTNFTTRGNCLVEEDQTGNCWIQTGPDKGPGVEKHHRSHENHADFGVGDIAGTAFHPGGGGGCCNVYGSQAYVDTRLEGKHK